MHAMDTTVHSFAYTMAYLREQVADVPAERIADQARGVRNHPAWVMGHLTHTCEVLGGVIGLEAWLARHWESRYGTGSVALDGAGAYEPKDELVAATLDAESRLIAAVRGLPASRLAEPFPDAALLEVFPTVGHALTQVMVGHAAFHVGQVSVWRKAMGYPAMRRVYE